jgi:hypothetical protein
MISKKVTNAKRVRQKLNEYEKFVKDEPNMPHFTCPHIDNVNDWLHNLSIELKLLKTLNSELRDTVVYWKNSCEEMQETINGLTEMRQNIRNIVN